MGTCLGITLNAGRIIVGVAVVASLRAVRHGACSTITGGGGLGV